MNNPVARNRAFEWARLLACGWVALLLASLAGCAMTGDRGIPVVREAWISDPVEQGIDSVAAWTTAEGKVLVFATAKDGHTVRVHDGDSGQFLRTIGGEGTGAGELGRPNGIFVIDDLAFVVENRNHRVQVFDLSRNASLGSFGANMLREPYGLWVQSQAPDRYRVYVTDSYYTPQKQVPPAVELGERVKIFDVVIRDDGIDGELHGVFGETTGPGVLRTVESIWGDPAHGRLLVADEDAASLDIKIYDFGGRYLERIGGGVFRHEPEGIALVECGGGAGYWLVSDQHPDRQVFRIFDRQNLQYVGAFRPAQVHTVDGVFFRAGASGRFPQGSLFTQHTDVAVAAFDWTDIAGALSLRGDCGR